MNGKSISVSVTVESSILAFSADPRKALQDLTVGAQIDALLPPEFFGDPGQDRLFPVVAAKVGAAMLGLHLDHAVVHFQHAHGERPAAISKARMVSLSFISRAGRSAR
jgi:hypothetical protein